MADPAAEHRRRASDRRARCAILTISDTRSPADDPSGDRIVELLENAGHTVVARSLVADEPPAIDAMLGEWIQEPDVEVVLCTGGTGIAARDTTIEVVRRRLTNEISGFGELMRMLSFEQVGAAAMLSRATAGLVAARTADGRGGDTFVFAMPGSPRAVELAMTRLILPELGHLIWLRAS